MNIGSWPGSWLNRVLEDDNYKSQSHFRGEFRVFFSRILVCVIWDSTDEKVYSDFFRVVAIDGNKESWHRNNWTMENWWCTPSADVLTSFGPFCIFELMLAYMSLLCITAVQSCVVVIYNLGPVFGTKDFHQRIVKMS